MATGIGSQRTGTRSHLHVMPRTALGWWAFGLLLAAAASPLYVWGLWVLVRFDDPEAHWRTGASVAVASPAVIVGSASLVRRASRSVVTIVLAVIVGLEIAWAVFFVTSFDNPGLGLAIGLGAAAAAAIGALIGLRTARG